LGSFRNSSLPGIRYGDLGSTVGALTSVTPIIDRPGAGKLTSVIEGGLVERQLAAWRPERSFLFTRPIAKSRRSINDASSAPRPCAAVNAEYVHYVRAVKGLSSPIGIGAMLIPCRISVAFEAFAANSCPSFRASVHWILATANDPLRKARPD
jgi:hypothetical protein